LSQATVAPTDQQEFSDADFRVVAKADQSKKLAFDLSPVTTATTIVWTVNAAGALDIGDGGTGSVLADPNADVLMFWDDSAGKVDWLTLGTGLSITGTTINVTAGLTTDSQQPTSDVNDITSATGFSACKTVSIWFVFSHTNVNAKTYAVQGRVNGGTWRTVASGTSLADATSSFGGFVSIANFNVATEKLAQYKFFTNANVLDDSSATNDMNTAAGIGVSMVAFNEIWSSTRLTQITPLKAARPTNAVAST
jgi:hypothetical protein